MKCKICERDVQCNNTTDYDIYDCRFCGKYKYCMSIEPDTYHDQSNFYKVSSWIREQNESFSNVPVIDNEKFDEVLNQKDKKIKIKFDFMMQYLSSLDNMTQLNEQVLVKCWISNTSELDILMEKADNHGLLEAILNESMGGYTYPYFKNLTFDGLEYIEGLDEPNLNSKNIFVAFNFTETMNELFENHVKSAIEGTGFIYTIVNQETTPHDQKITDEIVAKIKSSRMIIADFTYNSSNVYFEAGFAMGMKIPVIWTCKEGHQFSFDTGQFPHITWIDGNDLKKQLTNRIKAIM